MPTLKCPVCNLPLSQAERTLRCANGHCFDLAKQGYVNLLMSNRASGHGDDKKMVLARKEFLDRGYYSCLRDKLSSLAVTHTGAHVELLDAGGGEGWYTAGVKDALIAAGKTCSACCVDISKDALKWAAKRGGMTLAVASVSALPVSDASCDLLLNVFAPDHEAEFFRVLKPGGVLLRAVPLEDHLMGLKSVIYDTPYHNPAPVYAPQGFTLLERVEVHKTITLTDASDIQNLFLMTPYYYKTGKADQEKLLKTERLTTELAFCIFAYQKTLGN